MPASLKGVIAAIITPVTGTAQVDTDRLVVRARHMLDHGCDGLNLLGTTGEATSLSLKERMRTMEAVAAAGLPMDRIMVGTGASAMSDAVALSKCAADLGFAAALLLPPFYYKPVSDDGLIGYVGAIVAATASADLPIFLYNFPALSGIPYTVERVSLLLDAFGGRIAGLKDSSGDIGYAEQIAALSPSLSVFPSSEAVLLRARAGDFAGCISATANLNYADCARAFHEGDEEALGRAIAVRTAFSGVPLVPAIKETLARTLQDPALATLIPPLSALTPEQSADLKQRLDKVPADLVTGQA